VRAVELNPASGEVPAADTAAGAPGVVAAVTFGWLRSVEVSVSVPTVMVGDRPNP
jgi:hypothetical protein